MSACKLRWVGVWLLLHCLSGIARSSAVLADETVPSATELKNLSLEQLFDIQVTSVSKSSERLSETAAAVHVVTDEDIRRLGALSIPEALRDIPGLEVARIDSTQYAITARGFNGSVANKLLVMIDGRSVYTPLFSGVFWDAQDTLMEDIDRIEVVRGPGGTVWGANAVNGVINVITKPADETQGLLVTGGGGNEEQGFGGFRYGGTAGTNVFYRVYGKAFDRDGTLVHGMDAENDFVMGQGGFRVDARPSTENLLTLQGDIYTGNISQTNDVENTISGGNLLGRWTHSFADDNDMQLQTYYDRTERNIPSTFAERLDTWDADFHHRFPLGGRQEIQWGLGYRLTQDSVVNSSALAFFPAHRTRHLVSAFAQDEIKLANDRVRLTLGSKLEHNDYTGFEYEPSLRLAWTPVERHTFWGAFSREVRAPSRIDTDFFAPSTPPFLLVGGRGFDSEILYAYELGYKVQPVANFSASIATYYNDYHDLRSLETGPPFRIANGLEGEGYGVEVEATWQALPWWRWNAGYTLEELQLHTKPHSTDTTQELQEGDSPRHQFFVKSWMNFPHDVEFDVTIRWVDELPHQQIPSYASMDVHLSWQINPSWQVAIVGQNLLDSHHPEFGLPATRQEIERGVYGKVTCRY